MSSRGSRPPSERPERRHRPTVQTVLAGLQQQAELREGPKDPVSGLPDRVGFLRCLRRRLGAGEGFALLLVDLEDFKALNHERGFEAGDRLLAEVGRRLSGAVRRGDAVTRFGGDEFAVLLEGATTLDDALAAARRLLAVVGAEWDAGSFLCRPRACAGAAVSLPGQPVGRAEDLLHHADRALARARALGVEAEGFDPGMDARALSLSHLEAALRRTLGGAEFRNHFEPCVAPKTGRVAGFEVLLWRRPRGGPGPQPA